MSDKERLHHLQQMYGYIDSDSFSIKSVHFHWLLHHAEIAINALQDASQNKEEDRSQKRVYFHQLTK